MAFTPVPGEMLRRELRIEYSGGGLFYTPSKTIRLTNRRLITTTSAKRGQETTEWIPLQAIVYMAYGRLASYGWLYAAVIFGVFGAIVAFLTFFLLALPSIPVFLIALFCLWRFRSSRVEAILLDVAAEQKIRLVFGGDSGRIEDDTGRRIDRSAIYPFIEEIEIARQESLLGEDSAPAREDSPDPA